MYPDFNTNHHNTITRNLFVANPRGASFCGYFGNIPSKEYGGYAENATVIVVTSNVFLPSPNRARHLRCRLIVGRPRTGKWWENNVGRRDAGPPRRTDQGIG